jgi:hypothetical protein
VCCLPPPPFKFPRKACIADLWFGRVLCPYKFRVQTDSYKAASANDAAGHAGQANLRYTAHEVVLLATMFVFKPKSNEGRLRSHLMLFEPSPHHVMYVVPADEVLGRVPVVSGRLAKPAPGPSLRAPRPVLEQAHSRM